MEITPLLQDTHLLSDDPLSHREWVITGTKMGAITLAHRIAKKLLTARTVFKTRVSEFIKSVGADETDRSYEWKLNTPIGDLNISLWDSAIMCRFTDVEKAKKFTRQFTSQSCNPFSGKWNWHFDDDADTLNGNCEAQFVRFVTLLMMANANKANGERQLETLGK